MDLLEYQAKELFRRVGIPVLPAQRIDSPADLKGLKISYPVVLKSQVRVGGRAKAGGVRFVNNTIDAVAAAQTIFGLPILGEYPQAILAETKYDVQRELYLAIILDCGLRRPVLWGSAQGGGQVEADPERLQKVVVDQDFSPFCARHLGAKIDLQGPLLPAVSEIIVKMYRLFVQWDLDFLEINPLGVDTRGALMALDGKVRLNDYALGRHPELRSLVGEQSLEGGCPRSLPLGGNLAILANGTGLTWATLDQVMALGEVPRCYASLGDGEQTGTLGRTLARSLDQVRMVGGVKVVLVNLCGEVGSWNELGAYLEQYLQQVPPPPPLVIRWGGGDLATAWQALASLPVRLTASLEEAVEQAIALAKD